MLRSSSHVDPKDREVPRTSCEGFAVCLFSFRKLECFWHALVEPVVVVVSEASAFRARFLAKSRGCAPVAYYSFFSSQL